MLCSLIAFGHQRPALMFPIYQIELQTEDRLAYRLLSGDIKNQTILMFCMPASLQEICLFRWRDWFKLCNIARYVKRCRQFLFLLSLLVLDKTNNGNLVAVRRDKFLHSKRLRQMSDRRRFSVSLQYSSYLFAQYILYLRSGLHTLCLCAESRYCRSRYIPFSHSVSALLVGDLTVCEIVLE
jgi:hypothetical protein